MPHRFTIEEYRKLGETGLFEDMKTMLIQGELFTMGMPKPPHDFALSATYEFLRAICPAGHHVRNQLGFDIGTNNDPGPDLAVVPGAIRDYATITPTTAVLIVEVAHTTLFMDTTTKAELYATAGVPEYWVIDLEHRQLIVFRDPQPLPTGLGATAYRTHLTFGPTDSVSPLVAPTASVLVGDLLP
jgi:Uma2 family endonuclease